MPFDCPCADCALDLINNIGYYPCVLLNIVSVYTWNTSSSYTKGTNRKLQFRSGKLQFIK